MWHSRYLPKALYLLLQTYGAPVLSLKAGFAVCSSRLTLQGKTPHPVPCRKFESQLPGFKRTVNVARVCLCSTCSSISLNVYDLVSHAYPAPTASTTLFLSIDRRRDNVMATAVMSNM
jgi:hypothetical protein